MCNPAPDCIGAVIPHTHACRKAGSVALNPSGGPIPAAAMDVKPVARSGSIIAWFLASLVALCALVPYGLVAFGLRFVMARVFLLFGQPMIDGPSVPLAWFGPQYFFSVTLLAEIKAATFELFATQYAALPLPPTVAAYIFAYGLFVLPICLVVGFATRLAALALLALTVLLAVYVMPEQLWTTHVYWIAILLTLMTVGPGAISFDALIKYVYLR
jgi:putative oxidoreductase